MAQLKPKARSYEYQQADTDAAFTIAIFALVVLGSIIVLMVFLEFLESIPRVAALTLLLSVGAFVVTVGRAIHERAHATTKHVTVAPPQLSLKKRKLRRAA
jgi:hypothetical protein